MPKFTAGQHAYSSNGPTVPNGVYDFRIESIDRRGKGTPKEHLNIRFRVMNHPEHKGKIYAENFSLTAKSFWKLEKLLMATGLPIGAEYNTDDDDSLFVLLLSKLVRLKLQTYSSDGGVKQGIANNGFSAVEGGTEEKDTAAGTKSSVKEFLED